ncbi:hypothetical protein [Hymenobacter crusticola]|uniref:Uncharacterized protein n=1 Tax=Hymenobacter crusticola TaxID=1770526 RepID=A0A243W731_9BACT|nr:hypothetical protein [Hymenobacter crusticola]OUJ68670.1 hypothetical protein BXP70_27670 [Hymenobacter crusticola]
MDKRQNTIGFRKPMPAGADREPFLNGNGDEDMQDEKEQELRPQRLPVATPIFVDSVETNEILAAYNLFPLTPLNAFELQLVQVIAGLEQEVKKWH